MRLGIFAKTYARAGGLEATLDAVVADGLQAIQFNLALVGGAALPQEIPDTLAARVREAVAARGLEMVAVSGTTNLAHPDPATRAEGLIRLERLIAAAPALGTGLVTICTGTRDPDDMWRAHPDNRTAAAWADMLASVRGAVAAAEAGGVTIAFEPEPGNVVDGATAGRRLLDEIGSAHLRVVLDAANLIGAGELARQHAILDEAFALLGGDLVLAHAKDVREDGAVVPAGQGGLDYAHYAALLCAARYDGALVLHGLEPEDVPAALAHLRGV